MVFGSWISEDESIYKEKFIKNTPFPHVKISNFFSEDTVNKLLPYYDHRNQDWVEYWNPIEKKYALNKFDVTVGSIYDVLQGPYFVEKISKITGIPKLQSDPYLHGAGLHYHPRGSHLDMHLDYSIHPVSKLQRRLNLIVYLNDKWNPEWNGDLQFYDSTYSHCEKQYYPEYNNAILFQTSDLSYHGLPKTILCPENIGRKSLAIYYISEPEPDPLVRYKANFFPLPGEILSADFLKLYEIRNTRNIQEHDITKSILKEDYLRRMKLI